MGEEESEEIPWIILYYRIRIVMKGLLKDKNARDGFLKMVVSWVSPRK